MHQQCTQSELSEFSTNTSYDGSKDSSGEICDRFAQKDSRVKVIHKPNAGVSAARNTGIDIATGQFICFIDSDDWIESEYLQKIVDEIYDFDILFFGSVWHYEDGCSRSLSLQNSEYKKDIYTGIFHLLENDIDINYLVSLGIRFSVGILSSNIESVLSRIWLSVKMRCLL